MNSSFKKELKDSCKKFKLKPLCKPDVHLKRSRQRIFDENSIDLFIYSFGYQPTYGSNLCVLKENIILLIAGNYLNLLNTDTREETLLPSIYGAGFGCIAVHSSAFFAAAEKGPKFSIKIFSYPALEVCKTLKHESAIMPTCIMQFHPQGDLLIAITSDPENKVFIWFWELELMFYASEDSSLPVYSIYFSTQDEESFMTSGKGHVTFWNIICTRNDKDVITEVQVIQQEELLTESSKLDICCTISFAETFLSGTESGNLLLWNAESMTFDDTKKISMPNDIPCHDGFINHILIQNNFIVTLGSDGNIKFWDYNDIFKALNVENNEEYLFKDGNSSSSVISKSNTTGQAISDCIYITCIKSFMVSKISNLIYGIISSVAYDSSIFLIQDKNGCLFHAEIKNDLSNIVIKPLFSGVGLNLTDFSMCPIYPLIATVSKLGSVVIYDCVNQETFKFENFTIAITCILWPSAKVDCFASSFLLGFEDGSLRWISFTNYKSHFILKFVLKPHTSAVKMLKINDSYTVMISLGLDFKLFFYSVKEFLLIPLGFYIIHHDVIDITWLKYVSSSDSEEHMETLLIFCKYSYLVEVIIPDPNQFQNSSAEFRKTYLIETKQYQIYEINDLREYHRLGDRIYDSDCEEQRDLNEAGKEVLKKLKFEEKRETRENRRKDLGLSGPLISSEILCYLPSVKSNHIWLSLGKEDFGYIFEFKFERKFEKEPIELIPINALEILTTEIIPVLTMKYSPCGKFLFMGLQDGSINICYLEHAFMPTSGYDFAKYQIHDYDLGSISHLGVSSEGCFIATAGQDGNIFLLGFNMFNYKEIKEFGQKPTLVCKNEVEDIAYDALSLEDSLKKELDNKYSLMKEKRISVLSTLKEEYLLLKDTYVEYIDVCKSSLKKMISVPMELKLNLETYYTSVLAINMFSKETKRFKKDISNQFHKDLVKATLQYQKYFKFFKSRLDHERLHLKSYKDKNYLFTFRGCKISPSLVKSQLSIYPKMYQATEDKILNDVKPKTSKNNGEKLKLEHELALTYKAIIDYPCDTPISKLINKYNKRKEEQIKMIKEHIEEHENFEKICVVEEEYNTTAQKIQNILFKFKNGDIYTQDISECTCTYAEKKANTTLYYQKITDFWKSFNFFAFNAFEEGLKRTTSNDTQLEMDNDTLGNHLMRLIKHIYYKKENIRTSAVELKPNKIRVKWNLSQGRKYSFDGKRKENVLKIKEVQLYGLGETSNNFVSILLTDKPNLNCEKKFHDIRFILRCIELNIFRKELAKEKKWIKIIKELENLLSVKNNELTVLQAKISDLKNKRQQEKKEWIDVYKQFQKIVGIKHKHKGYFKQIFRKKIRPDSEKEPYERHPSSESSDSEYHIESEDDCPNADSKEVDQNLLRQVMHYRVKRHKVEHKMKQYKRNLLADSAKELVLQRQIQQVKDTLREALSEFSSISMSRKFEWKNLKWPVVLHPQNIHMEFIDKQDIRVDKQKIIILKKMFDIHETINNELETIDKFINNLILLVTDEVVNAEVDDLIDIAVTIYPTLDYISKTEDQYLKLSCSESPENLQKEIYSKEKPVNYIREILSSVEKNYEELHDQTYFEKEYKPRITTPLMKPAKSLIHLQRSVGEVINGTHGRKITIEEFLCFDDIKNDSLIKNKKVTFKSWKDVDDELLSKNVDFSNFDVESITLDRSQTLDCSLFYPEFHSSEEDYYMQPFPLNMLNENMNKIKNQLSGLELTDHLKMLLDLDVAEIVEKILRCLEEEDSSYIYECMQTDSYFPTHAGGGLVLSKKVLKSMEEKDPDSFPYIDFYQEIVHHEKIPEKPKLIHISTDLDDGELQLDFTIISVDDFIALNIKKILNSLRAYLNIKAATTEYEFEMRNLNKKVMKARNKRINIEQTLFAFKRERLAEMNNKFSGTLNLDLLQDVIGNPYLHIQNYEANKKIDLMKKDILKLKASEVATLKSLDEFGFEDTKLCHELLQLRQEFRLLRNYFSDVHVIPMSGDAKTNNKHVREDI